MFSDLVQKAIADGTFSYDDENGYMVYNLRKIYAMPYNETEESVRADIIAKLIYRLEYPKHLIELEKTHKMGSSDSKKKADITIYSEDTKDNIVIETKAPNIKNLSDALAQADSYKTASLRYAFATNGKELIGYFYDKSRVEYNEIPKFKGDKPKWTYLRDGENAKLEPLSNDDLKTLLDNIHDDLWAGGKRNPAEAFSEFSKIIFTKISDEKAEGSRTKKVTDYYEFQISRDERVVGNKKDEISIKKKQNLKERVQKLYDIYKEKDKNVFDENLNLDYEEIYSLVNKLESTNLNKTDIDIKGKVFQKFFADFFKGDAGQYFTPMNIVRFMVDSVVIDEESDRVIDPSCGSGGFLLQALVQLQIAFKDDREKWHKFAENNLFGIEINSGISRTAKMNMIIHDDGHTNVITNDMFNSFELFKKTNLEFKESSFSYIFTNPPFGSTIRSSKPYFSSYDFSKKQINFIDRIVDSKNSKSKDQELTEVLAFQRYHELLKDEGLAFVVVPDGILTNSSHQDLRDYILTKFYLVASVSLPQHTFSNYGAGVKSSIVVLQKKSSKDELDFNAYKDNIERKITNNYKNEILSIRDELKSEIKPLNDEVKVLNKELKSSDNRENVESSIEELKDKVSKLKSEYKTKEENIKEKIVDEVRVAISDYYSYDTFIAEVSNIGEDATGRKICEFSESDLAKIQEELKEFITNFKVTVNAK